jgi:hypothetical protein
MLRPGSVKQGYLLNQTWIGTVLLLREIKRQRSSDLSSQRTIQPVEIYRYYRSKYITVLYILTYTYIDIPYECDNLPLWLKNITLSHPEFKQRNKNTKYNYLQQQKLWRLRNNVKLKLLFCHVLPDTWNSSACIFSFPRFAHLSFW